MKRVLSIAIAAILSVSLLPFTLNATSLAAETLAPVGFEDGTVGEITSRNDDGSGRDTSVLEVTDAEAHSGTHSLKVTGRSDTWNGPQLHLEKYIEAGKTYQITIWVRGIPESSIQYILSAQTGASGPYQNIDRDQSFGYGDGWKKLTGEFTFNTTEFVAIYIESGSATAEFYIDDVSIMEAGSVNPDFTLPALKDIYKDYFPIGTAVTPNDLAGDFLKFVSYHTDIVTYENAMKPEALSGEKDVYDFETADKMYDTISGAGLKVHAHTLVWHQQSPAWLNVGLSHDEAQQNLKNYISTVAGHFKGKVVSWDVVNEAVLQDGGGTRQDSPWYLAYGSDDYIYDAFKYTYEADPGAIRYYNDFNLNNPNKADTVVKLVTRINDRWTAEGGEGLLIQGVGMQGHYDATTITPEAVEDSIKKFIALGVEVSITELDVTTSTSGGSITEAGEQAQAVVYAQLFQVFKKYSDSIARVTFWRLDDGGSWRSSQAPLPFDKYLSAKTAYTAIIDPDKFLTEVSKPSTTKLANVKGGSPKIDGDIDAVWEWDSTAADDKPVQIASMLQAWDIPSGSFKLLWDADNLYVLAQVRAPIADDLNGIEVFIDEGGEKSETYDSNDRWYAVTVGNALTSSGSTDGAESAVKVDGGKYTVELKIPFQNKAHKGADILGFDIRVTNAADGAVAGRAVFNDTTGMSETSTAYLGEAMLFAAIVPAPSVAPSAAPSGSPSGSDDGGGFPWWIVGIVGGLVAVGAACFAVLKSKKKK
ncbi:hypothetical protein FACS18949_01280 [Clostridia bacterium]|nr:hypothetical protein FACS18949_01280 [Clostridia bacterium]